MYNAHFFAQIVEGKIRMHIIPGYNSPMYNAHEMWCAQYMAKYGIWPAEQMDPQAISLPPDPVLSLDCPPWQEVEGGPPTYQVANG